MTKTTDCVTLPLFKHYRCHTGPLLKKHNGLNIYDTFKLELGIFMYKHQTKRLPIVFSEYFTKNNQIHNYQTRNASDYSINKTKKRFSDRAVRTTGPVLWNTLDANLKQCKTIKHFRNTYKSNLIADYN